MQLKGYVRQDGRVGFRNHVLIMPLTGCACDLARRIGERVPGATWFVHPNGCDLHGPDFELMGKILEHFVTHPNVGGVLFLSMSCSAALSLKLWEVARQSGRLVEHINVQRVGGTSAAVDKGASVARGMAERLQQLERAAVPLSALMIGTKCGASDANSFRWCHPVVGRACDLLVAQGATVVLSEDCELVAAADRLAERAATATVAEQIRGLADSVNGAWTQRFGQTLDEFLLSAGQSREQMVQASLNHAAKAGSTPFTGFFDMAELVGGPGLVILNAPNTDLENATCLAAAGCNVILFTTGRGTPVGSPASITLKITATQSTYQTMAENIDLCVAGVADGKESIDKAAARVLDTIVAAANGQATAAERCRHYEVAIPIRGVTF